MNTSQVGTQFLFLVWITLWLMLPLESTIASDPTAFPLPQESETG